MMTRKLLYLSICNQARYARKAFLEKRQDDLFKCLDDILYHCEDETFVDIDQQLLSTIKQECEKARVIVKSDSPDQNAFLDCLSRIMNKAQEKLKGNCKYYAPKLDESKQCTKPFFALGSHECGGPMKNKGEQGGKPCEPDSCEYYEPKSQHQKQ